MDIFIAECGDLVRCFDTETQVVDFINGLQDGLADDDQLEVHVWNMMDPLGPEL